MQKKLKGLVSNVKYSFEPITVKKYYMVLEIVAKDLIVVFFSFHCPWNLRKFFIEIDAHLWGESEQKNWSDISIRGRENHVSP